MNLHDALLVSKNVRDTLAPLCQEAEITGSIRRRALMPGDIDVVAIPTRDRPRVSFGQTEPVHSTFLDGLLWKLEQSGLLRRLASGPKLKRYELDITKWGIGGARPVVVRMQIHVCTSENYAYWKLITTGPADFSHWIVTNKRMGGALPNHMKFSNCQLNVPMDNREHPIAAESASGKWAPLSILTEAGLFDAIGLPYIDPSERRAPDGWRRG